MRKLVGLHVYPIPHSTDVNNTCARAHKPWLEWQAKPCRPAVFKRLGLVVWSAK